MTEIESLQKENAEERAAHNSHVTELIEAERLIESQKEEIDRLLKVEADYKPLQQIMDRARKLAFQSQQEEEDRPRFKMDANGNLTRVEY